MKSPFVTINRPDRGGTRHVEALAVDVLTKCHAADPVKYQRLCTAAKSRGITPVEYVEGRIKDLLQLVVFSKPYNQNGTN